VGLLQNKWIRFIKGCLVIRLGGDYLERFLNMCRLHNIYLWDIRRSEDICYCELYASDFFRLPPLLRKTGTKVKVMKKRGIPFYIPFLKKRIIFFIGVASCLIMLNVVTDYVWAIEYIGNLQISDDELTDFLEEQEIHYGMRKDSLDCEAKEKKLRETFPTVTWTSIYFEGTKLYIEIKENEKSEPVEIKTKGMDIVADASGTITSILTRNGVPKVKAGETVEEGQILVAGGVPVYNEAQEVIDYQIYDADADIWIQTVIDYQDFVGESYPMIYYTGKEIHTGFVEAFGRHFDGLFLHNLFQNKQIVYETTTQKQQLVLLDNIYLPIYYGKIDRKEYYLRYLTYTSDEMEQILTDNFEKFISGLREKGVQIVEKNVKIVQNRSNNKSGMEMIGEILVIQPTGERRPIQMQLETSGIQ